MVYRSPSSRCSVRSPPTMSDLESSLRQRLLDSQADFLAVRDTAALHAFSERWATLCEDFEQALNSQPLDDSLVSLAQSIASHLVAFAELQLREQELTDAFLQEVDVLFSEMSLSDDHVPVAPSPRRQAARRRPSPTASILPFYPASYDWLLHNLHDPYPSTALKSSLANSAKVTTNLIDSWFKAIRKEIGWDALRRRHFKGSRSFTSAAALRCFVEDSQNLPFEIASAFIVMKEKAEALFPSPNPSSTHRRSSSTSSLATDDSGTSRTTPFSSSSDSPVSSRPPSLVFSISDSDVEESPVSYSSWHASLDQLQSLRDGIWCVNIIHPGPTRLTVTQCGSIWDDRVRSTYRRGPLSCTRFDCEHRRLPTHHERQSQKWGSPNACRGPTESIGGCVS